MDIRLLGRTGLRVSALGLGTMSWGRDTDEHDAADQLDAFLDAGGNLVDTAAMYGDGASEAVIGSLLRSTAAREDIVLVTKAGPREIGETRVVDTSRGHLLSSLDASLKRLGTDHVDLFLVHAPDPHTRDEEVVSALVTAVRSGRTRYVGISNYSSWTTARLATLLEAEGIELAATQMEYSLLERGIDRELLPACERHGVGVMSWSPLGRGVLTGKYRHTVPADSRAATPHLSGFVQQHLNDRSAGIVEAVATAAQGLSMSALDVALGWVLSRPISTAVVGARTVGQLTESLAAADVLIPEPVIAALDEVSAIKRAYPENRQ